MQNHRLETICDVKSGGTPSRSDLSNYGGKISWAKISDIEACNGTLNYTEETITENGLKAIRNRVFKKGTLLFAMYGSVGKMAFAGKDLTTNQAILGIDIKDKSKLFDRYLYYWLSDQKEQLLAQANGVTQKNLSATFVRNLSIPLPPLKEQKRIAAILDKADAIRRSRKKAIALTEELLRSTFLDMFGDPGRNPKGWKKAYVTDIAEKVTDGTHHTPERTSTGIKLLSARNIKNGCIDVSNSVDFIPQSEFERLKKRYNPKPQDVLISCSGSVGRVTVVRDFEPFSMVRSVAVIRPKSDIINSEFLESLLLSPYLQASILRGSKKSSQANLFQGAIKELPVIIPPLPAQNQWNNYKCSLLNLVNQHSRLSRLNSDLFNSLLQKAFRGEL